MSHAYTLDEMRDELQRRASRTPTASLLAGMGDLFNFAPPRLRTVRPRMKPVEEAIADDWAAVGADLEAAFADWTLG